ncbi:MAG: 3-hydroxyacyl-CoA dehydrogenase family protein [Peptococcaceae bacterium]
MIRQVKDIKTIIIAGAGIMGSSFAQIFARNGFKVILYDIAEQFLQKSRDLIALNQKTAITAGVLTAQESQKILDNIAYSLEIRCFSQGEFVLEAIVENLAVKEKFWRQVSEIVSAEAILATNTSGLSINEIARNVKKPERFAGMHWVNPPHIVPLVEVIGGEHTDPRTTEMICELAEYIGKKPVKLKKDAKGFILNRIQYAVLREAMYIVDSGIAGKEDVDNVLKYGLGMRYACIGPFETADLGGLDTFYNVACYLFADLSNTAEVSPLLADCIKEGAYGVKSGKGFYDYANGRAEQVIAKRDADFIKIAKCLSQDQ